MTTDRRIWSPEERGLAAGPIGPFPAPLGLAWRHIVDVLRALALHLFFLMRSTRALVRRPSLSPYYREISREPPMPPPKRRHARRDLYFLDWENATVQFTGRALIEACQRDREARRLVAEVLERALRRARRGRHRRK
jgi:hypothetical protein